MSHTWKWWGVINLVVWTLGLTQYHLDIFGFVMANDATYISLAIALITAAVSIGIGWGIITKKLDSENNLYWFASDAVLSLGMVGTLLGFLMVLGSAFSDIDTSSIDSMTDAIALLASGMSTALLTSLVGLISSLVLKVQLVIGEG